MENQTLIKLLITNHSTHFPFYLKDVIQYSYYEYKYRLEGRGKKGGKRK
ncbi:protein of unknown function [Candidatus Nitrosocosmicus franklandus]|uniref:Uncharacterized protein n=1 Tax=Candidatus Nitrosocosmicus franklandianus TaxID=1798806 RepID=A0A484IC13_9ARCH|nr:protein of unknown function [Candidatus Nitrosocosmicus franklandus]